MRSKIVAIVEARVFSVRLPRKEMRQIIGRPMLELLIERLKRAKKIDQIIIATTNSPEEKVIIELAKKMGIQFFRGSSEDVLDRVLQAAKIYHGDIIVMITGDNPLLDPLLIDKIIQIFLDNIFDYVSNGMKRTYPWGLRVQVFSTKILQEVSESTNDLTDREHITSYIYEHPEKYKLHNIEAPPEFHYPDYRWTVDYVEDLQFVRKIYESLYPKNPNFSTKDIINLLKTKPELIEINAHRKQKLLH